MNTKNVNKKMEKKMFMQQGSQDLKTERGGIVALSYQAKEEADYVGSPSV